MKTPLNWTAVMGKMTQKKDILIFKGGKLMYPGQEQEGSEVGLFICNRTFSGGTISVNVRFDNVSLFSTAEIVVFYNPQSRFAINAGLGMQNQFIIRQFDGSKWATHASSGATDALEVKKIYRIEAILHGSTLSLKCDGVDVLRHTLPYPVPQSQVGVFGLDRSNIEFRNFEVISIRPKAFVVMQFSPSYDDVYSEVIKNVCREEGVDVIRGDEEFGPGQIIQDINRTIRDSNLVIADISPVNANVFYEVGYAHALNKPTILLAEKGTKLPFDVSSFRTLFYENTIGGKRTFEETLRKHIRASLDQK